MPTPGSFAARVGAGYLFVAGVAYSLLLLQGAYWWTIPWAIFVAIVCLRCRWSVMMFVKLWAVQTFVVGVKIQDGELQYWWAGVMAALMFSTIGFVIWMAPAWILGYVCRPQSVAGAEARTVPDTATDPAPAEPGLVSEQSEPV